MIFVSIHSNKTLTYLTLQSLTYAGDSQKLLADLSIIDHSQLLVSILLTAPTGSTVHCNLFKNHTEISKEMHP